MDLMLLRVFQSQLLFQAECALRAVNEVNAALKSQDVLSTFGGLQNMLTALANMSKALWGQTNDAAVASARKPLRDSIGLDDTSPLRNVRMRNNFEHYDERIERWWETSPTHNHIDMNIAPASMIRGFDPIEMFRSFDPQSCVLEFWGQSFNVQEVTTELQRILPKLREEAGKSHWET